MNITYLELITTDLQKQYDFYSGILGLTALRSPTHLEILTGATRLVFTTAAPDLDGAYHFAFDIPENQFFVSKEWLSQRIPLLHDNSGKEVFESKGWNSHSLYFKDPAGNILEFIARHNLKNAQIGDFDSKKILNVSEIGLPSEDVIALADRLCSQLGVAVFHQEPSETFTPIGDDNGLFILPIKDRIWMPDSGVPAKLLPVTVRVDVDGMKWEVRGVPYEIIG